MNGVKDGINNNENENEKGGRIRKSSNMSKISNTVAGVIAAARLLGTPKRTSNHPNFKLKNNLPIYSNVNSNDISHTDKDDNNTEKIDVNIPFYNNGKLLNIAINQNDTNNSRKINSFPIKKKVFDGRMRIPLVTGIKFGKKTDENMDIVGIRQNSIKNDMKNNIIIGNLGSEKLLGRKKNGKTSNTESVIASNKITSNLNKNGKVKEFSFVHRILSFL